MRLCCLNPCCFPPLPRSHCCCGLGVMSSEQHRSQSGFSLLSSVVCSLSCLLAAPRIRLLYPSEWNSEFWRNKILKAKLKRTALWEKFASLLGSAQGDRSSVAQTIEPRIVNSLAIRVRNIHVHIVDDNLGATPWAFEVRALAARAPKSTAELFTVFPLVPRGLLASLPLALSLLLFIISCVWLFTAGASLFDCHYVFPHLTMCRPEPKSLTAFKPHIITTPACFRTP